MKKSQTFMLSALALSLGACAMVPSDTANAPSTAQPVAATASFDAFRDAFLQRYFELDPYFAVYQGRHEFDGQIPDWSEEGLTRMKNFLRSSIADAR